MSDITITGKVAEQLQQLAESKHRTVEEFLEDVLEPYVQDDQDVEMGTPGSLKRMAWLAEHNPIVGTETDISERSREILRDMYETRLQKKIAKRG